jgi:hypothetical protein
MRVNKTYLSILKTIEKQGFSIEDKADLYKNAFKFTYLSSQIRINKLVLRFIFVVILLITVIGFLLFDL